MKQPKNMREARLHHKTSKSGNASNRGDFSLTKNATAKALDQDKGYFKTYFNRGTVIGAFIGTALAISVPSIASEGFMPDSGSGAHSTVASTATANGSKPGTGSINVLTTGGSSATDGSEAATDNQAKVNDVRGTSDSSVNADVQSCAESENGLVKAASDALNVRTTIFAKVIDVNQIFQPKKQGGCFADLGEIPDLSATIPTWSGMQDKIIGALKDYANKKVCDAVYEASEQVVGPIRESMKEIQDYSQAYDFAKEFAGVTGDKLGIDPSILMPDKTDITYTVGGYKSSTTPNDGSGSVTGGSSNSGSNSGSTSTDNSKAQDDPYSQGSTLDTRSNSTKTASSFFSGTSN